MGINDAEIRMLFEHFDKDMNKNIDFEEFIQGVRDPLSEERLALVHMAFDILDTDKSGFIDAEEISEKYDCTRHPDVLAGRRTPEQIMLEFLNTFDVGGVKDGHVTRQEFINYYTNIGANIDNDEYFELMIRNAWHISGGTGAAANSANARVLVTYDDGTQGVEEVKNDLGMRRGDTQDALERLKAQGASHVSSVSFGDSAEDTRSSVQPDMFVPHFEDAKSIGRRMKQNDYESRNHIFGGEDTTLMNKGPARKPFAGRRVQASEDGLYGSQSYKFKHGSSIVIGDAGGDYDHNPRVKHMTKRHLTFNGQTTLQGRTIAKGRQLQDILDEIFEHFQQRGIRGIVALQRKFRQMDADKDGTLDMEEFKKGLRDCKIFISDEDCRWIFHYFDTDKSGGIDFEEFLIGVKGPMSDRRRDLIKMAFDFVDANRNGILEPLEVIRAYNAMGHPEMAQGRRSAKEIFREFLDCFFVAGDFDHLVSYAEWFNYYSNLGAVIDDDDYFEQMLINTWNLNETPASKSSVVSKMRKSENAQLVEELSQELGISPLSKDASGLIRRLKDNSLRAAAAAQSLNASSRAPVMFAKPAEMAAATMRQRHKVVEEPKTKKSTNFFQDSQISFA
jgi:Ca2+-binding EF-hand superfamily protein